MAVCLLIFGSLADAKKINPKFDLSISERTRLVTWDNSISLADSAQASRTFTRHRTSVMGQWSPNDQFEIVLKFTNEFRHYFTPENTEFTFNEIIFDQLYVNYKNAFGLSGDLTVGRQNIMLGEGFVIMDGSPLDGSRTVYFNAVRFDWRVKPQHQLTAFYTYMDETDNWLPVINSQDQALLEQPEEGFGVYYTGAYNCFNLDLYAIRKNAKANTARPVKSNINTLGMRIKKQHTEFLYGVLESAFQFGKHGDTNRSAVGGYLYEDFTLNEQWYFPHSLRAGAIYLSGQNPDSDKWTAWDPMFARWPKWSESYIYTQVPENGVAYWSNLISLYFSMNFKLDTGLDLLLAYHHLMAEEKTAVATAFPGGTGNTRGDLFIVKFNYKFNERWSGHILFEKLDPGSYYFPGADKANWMRSELMYNW